MQTLGSVGLSDLDSWDPQAEAFSDKEFNSYTKGLGKAYSSREQGEKEVKLFVKGIPNELSPEGLKNLFIEHGDVLSVKKCTSKFPEQEHTFGFVSYRTTREALAAIQKLDGFQITKKFHLQVIPAITDVERRKQQEERQEEEKFLNSLQGHHNENGVAGSDDSSKENKIQVSQNGVSDLAAQFYSSEDTGVIEFKRPEIKTEVLAEQNIEPKSEADMPKHVREKPRVSVIDRLAASARQCEQQPLSVDVPNLSCAMARKPGATGPQEGRGLGRGLLAVNSTQFGSQAPRVTGGMVGSYPRTEEGDDVTSFQECESLKITVDCGIGARQVKQTQDKVAVPDVAKHDEVSPSGRGHSFYESPEHFPNGSSFPPTNNFSSQGFGRGQYVLKQFQPNFGHPANRPKMPFSPRGHSPVNQTSDLSHNLVGQGYLHRPRDHEVANQSISSRHSDSGSGSSEKPRKSPCKFCGKPGTCKCAVCKTSYCGQECQREDWKTHKFECKPISSTVTDCNKIPKEEDLCQGFEVSVDEDVVAAFQKKYKNIPVDQFPPMPLSTLSPRTSTALSSPVSSNRRAPLLLNNPVAHSAEASVPQRNPRALNTGASIPQRNPGAHSTETSIPQQNLGALSKEASIPQQNPWADTTGTQVMQTSPVTGLAGEPAHQNSISIPTRQLAINTLIQGFLSWMTSPTCLWAGTVADVQQYEQLNQQLNKCYNEGNEKLNMSFIPSKGDYCAGFYEAFGTWNRCLVQQVYNNTATVLFIDYGNSEVLLHKFIRKLLPHFYSLPPQAYPCSLKDFTEKSEVKWSEKSCGLMKKVIAENTPYMLNVVECINGVSIIELFNTDSPGGPSLNDQLKSAGCPVSETPEKRVILSDSLPSVCEEIKQGDRVSIAVCHADDPWEFKIHLCDPKHVAEFQKFNQELNLFYDSQPAQPCLFDTIGELVVAKFSADNKWYRAKVLQINKNEVDLLFVDFGNLERRSTKDIRAAGTRCQAFPIQAVNCGLDGIMPLKGNHWPEEAVQVIQTLPANLRAQVKSKTGQKLNLEIYEDETSTLSSYIVKMGLAKFSQSGGSVHAYQVQRSDISESATSSQQTQGVKTPVFTSQSANVLSAKFSVGCPTRTICHVVNNDGTFYLQSLADENQETLAKIVSVDDEYKCRRVVPFQPELNQKVCAQFCGSWSRGLVQEAFPDGTVTVFFVDYGNSEILPINVVQPLVNGLADIPAQGIKCRLNGSETLNWSARMTEQLKKMICDEAPTVTLVKEKKGCSFVDIILDDVNINSAILALGTFKDEQLVSQPLKPNQIPKALETIPGLSLKVGLPTAAQCCVVSEDGTFFVQIVDDANISNLAELDRINAAYQSKLPSSYHFEKGQIVCAKYNNYWCRGTVEDILIDGSVKVFFMDYGNTETLPSVFVQPLEGFLDIPAQAIKCKLNGCDKVTWCKATVSKLNTLIFEKLLTVTVLEEQNGSNSVNVESKGISVNAAILASGLSKISQPVTLSQGQVTPGRCWVVTENGTFYMQLMTEENIPILEQLNQIHVAYHERAYVPAVLQKGQYVCAKFEEFWCRGLVEDLLSNGLVTVFFVDYGNTETLPANFVQPLDDTFMALPAQAIKCFLNGTDTISWFAELTNKVKELTVNKISNMTLVKELNGLSFVNVEVDGINLNAVVVGTFNSKISLPLATVPSTPAMNGVGTVTTNMASMSLQSSSCVKLTADKPLSVSCVLIEPDGSFFVQDISPGNRQTLLNLFKMDEIYQERPITMLVPFKPIRGQLACAQFLDSWNRARIRSIKTDGSVEVFFVDYGNVEVVPSKSVQELDEEYWTIPAQAIRCVLHGYEKVHWSPELVQKLSDLILNQEVVVSLVREVDGCNFVNLHLQEKGVDVNTALLEDCKNSKVSEREHSKVSQSRTTTNINTLKELGLPSLPAKGADLVLMTMLSPAEFYCVQGEAEAITQSVHQSCDSLPYDRSYSPAINELCCAHFAPDNRWYRAVVTDKEEASGQFEVMYIDYGNEAIVEQHSLRRPPQAFTQPPCAVRCFIPGVSCGPDGLWSPESIELIQCLSEQLVHVEVLRVVDGHHEVKLIHNEQDIGEKLRGLCSDVKIPTPSAGGDVATSTQGQGAGMSQAQLHQQNEELRRQLMQLQALVAQQAANKG